MTTTCYTTAPLAPATAKRRTLWQVVTGAPALTKQRRDLAALEPHMLQDIGLCREDVQRETGRPFWDAPQHWRKHG